MARSGRWHTERRWVAAFLRVGTASSVIALGLMTPVRPAQLAAVREQMVALGPSVARAGWSRPVHAAEPFQLVGFDWQGTNAGTLAVRTKTAAGWSGWTQVDGSPAEGPDFGSLEYHRRTAAGPIWLGSGVRDLQVKVVDGALSQPRLHAIRSPLPSGSSSTAWASSVLASRADWGADESWRRMNKGCGTPQYAASLRAAVVHHTDNQNDYTQAQVPAILRGIYYFHTHVNGWCDIGYNFVVDRFGTIWEGRAGGVNRAVVGAHAGGFNSGTTGIALLGNLDNTWPSVRMYWALVDLLTWKLPLHGVHPLGSTTLQAASFSGSRFKAGASVPVSTITGHRDLDYTGCPGEGGERILPGLRSDVAQQLPVWQR